MFHVCLIWLFLNALMSCSVTSVRHVYQKYEDHIPYKGRCTTFARSCLCKHCKLQIQIHVIYIFVILIKHIVFSCFALLKMSCTLFVCLLVCFRHTCVIVFQTSHQERNKLETFMCLK